MTDKVRAADAPAPAHLIPGRPEGSVRPGLGPGTGRCSPTNTSIWATWAILDAGAATFATADVVMLRVHLTKRDDFAAMNDAYDAFAVTGREEQRGDIDPEHLRAASDQAVPALSASHRFT